MSSVFKDSLSISQLAKNEGSLGQSLGKVLVLKFQLCRVWQKCSKNEHVHFHINFANTFNLHSVIVVIIIYNIVSTIKNE